MPLFIFLWTDVFVYGLVLALLLYVVREMSYAEIASALNVSVGAVKSRIFRAREALLAPPRPHNGESR